MVTSFVSLLLLQHFISITRGQDYTDYKKLFKDVFLTNQKEVFPRHNASTPLEISSTFYLMSVTNFDELQETIVLLAGIGAAWTDAGLTWDPSSYGGIWSITVPVSSIWVPPITLVNAVDVLQRIGKDSDNYAMVLFNGTVMLPMGGIVSAKCTTDIHRFPYDTQVCGLKFVSWGFVDFEIFFSAHGYNTDFYTKNSNWNLQNIRVKVESWNGYSTFQVFLTITRQSLYYSVLVVCPSVMFSLLNPLVFLLPIESGERIGLATTILLSYAIFLTLVSSAIPASSNPMCFLLIVMIVTINVSGGIVVMAILSVVIHFRDQSKQPINSFWKFLATRLVLKRTGDTVVPLKSSAFVQDSQHKSADEQEVHEVTWTDVSKGLDILCITIFYVIILVIVVIFFGIVS